MKQGMLMNTLISAVVGGVIGAGVVFFGLPKDTAGDLKELTVADLKVTKLTITEQAALLNKDGKENVVLKEGSVMAENVILGNKFIGKQFQGHAIVANRVFATPDDLFTTPMNQWRFFAELGSSKDGGEVVVRSINGPASVDRPVQSGALIRTGFDPEAKPQILALQNDNRSPMSISNDLSEQQRQMLSTAAPAGAAANFNGSTAPAMGATASTPNPNAVR